MSNQITLSEEKKEKIRQEARKKFWGRARERSEQIEDEIVHYDDKIPGMDDMYNCTFLKNEGGETDGESEPKD